MTKMIQLYDTCRPLSKFLNNRNGCGLLKKKGQLREEQLTFEEIVIAVNEAKRTGL